MIRLVENIVDATPAESAALARIYHLAIPMLQDRGFGFDQVTLEKCPGGRPMAFARAHYRIQAHELIVEFIFDFVSPPAKTPFHPYPSVWLLSATVIYPTHTQPEIFDLADAVIDGSADDVLEALGKLVDNLTNRFAEIAIGV